MHMMHICKSNKYRSIINRVSQNPRCDRKIKTVIFLLSIQTYQTHGNMYHSVEIYVNKSADSFLKADTLTLTLDVQQ